MEIEKVGYSGEFYIKAIWSYAGKEQLLQRYQFNKDFSAKIVIGQILTGDIQVIVK